MGPPRNMGLGGRKGLAWMREPLEAIPIRDRLIRWHVRQQSACREGLTNQGSRETQVSRGERDEPGCDGEGVSRYKTKHAAAPPSGLRPPLPFLLTQPTTLTLEYPTDFRVKSTRFRRPARIFRQPSLDTQRFLPRNTYTPRT